MIPCKDCIVLPICKSKVGNYKEAYYNYTPTFIVLATRCSTLTKYITINWGGSFRFNKEKTDEIQKFFKSR